MGISPNHIIAVDLDNDQKLDLVTANTGAVVGVGLTIRKGDGLGGFGNSVATALAQAPTNLASADFNLDGNADVVVSQAAAQFSYLAGKGAIGAATFNTPVTVAVATQAGTIVAAPFHTNSDDLYDVVTTSSNTNNLSISLNVCQ